MNWPPLTIADCDERIYACRQAFIQAELDGDTITADAMEDTMNELWERRAHIPRPRLPVE
jgi:hypothetical protein